MPVRPFRFVNVSECAWLAALVKDTVDGWAGQWLREPRVGAVSVVPADRDGEDGFVRDGVRWTACLSGVHEGLFLATTPGLIRSFAAMAFGASDDAVEPAPGGLIDDLFAKAAADLARRVFERAGEDGEGVPQLRIGNVPAQVWWRASGAVVAALPFGGRQLALLLDEPLLRRLLVRREKPVRPRPLLADPRQALGTAKVRVGLHAGEAELDIGQLQSLAPGDVVPLAASIHLPLRITVDGRPAPVRAFLGRAGPRKALQLVPRLHDPGP